jgi:hypothetical protein
MPPEPVKVDDSDDESANENQIINEVNPIFGAKLICRSTKYGRRSIEYLHH